MPNDDLALLRDYARNNSEAAFAELVSRHVNLVYSVSLRQVRDPHLVEEIIQAIFIILARKAGSLVRHPGLSGWLLQTTRYAANAHSLELWKDSGDGKGFVLLTYTTSTDYADISPLPEPGVSAVWKYKAVSKTLRAVRGPAWSRQRFGVRQPSAAFPRKRKNFGLHSDLNRRFFVSVAGSDTK
jgi:hypothetical protein